MFVSIQYVLCLLASMQCVMGDVLDALATVFVVVTFPFVSI